MNPLKRDRGLMHSVSDDEASEEPNVFKKQKTKAQSAEINDIFSKEDGNVFQTAEKMNIVCCFPACPQLDQALIKQIILPLLYSSQNRFCEITPPGKSYGTLACVSICWENIIEENNLVWNKEHKYLQSELAEQESLKKVVRDKWPERFINYHRGVSVLNLTSFAVKEIDQILNDIFLVCMNIKHLKVDWTDVTKFPSGCNQLMTLDASHCPELISFINPMRDLTHLILKGCDNLIKVPDDMSALTNFDCSDCFSFKTFPNGLISLINLNISGSPSIRLLHYPLPKLEKLICFCCLSINSFPEFLSLTDFEGCLHCCISLESVPPNTWCSCMICRDRAFWVRGRAPKEDSRKSKGDLDFCSLC